MGRVRKVSRDLLGNENAISGIAKKSVTWKDRQGPIKIDHWLFIGRRGDGRVARGSMRLEGGWWNA